MRPLASVLALTVPFALVFSAAACENQADLETLEYAMSKISVDGEATARVTSGNRVEVQGRATNHDKFQHDVYFTATLLDKEGKAVGTASGKLEDWAAGHTGVYKLVGTTRSSDWARVRVVVSNVTEHVRGRPE